MDAVSHDSVASNLSTSSSQHGMLMLRRLWEHPHTKNTIWLARATPRAWLAEGEVIQISDAPCSLGRLSFVLRSEIDSTGCITANLSLAPHKTARASSNVDAASLRVSSSGSGGAVLRLRTPGKRAIVSVHAGGVPLQPTRWNVTDESITFAAGEQMAQFMAARLRVCYD